MTNQYDFSKYKDITLGKPDRSELDRPKRAWVEQRKWDIPEALVIKVAPVGAFIMKEDNPNQKYTTREIRNEIVQCLEAGACAFHTHARNEQGKHTLELKFYHEIIDPVKAKYGKDVLVCGCPEGGRDFEESLAPIVEFKGIIETAPITVSTVCLTGDYTVAANARAVKAHVEVMQDVGCKPEVVMHNIGDISLVKRWLIDTGVLKKPYSFRIALGNPGWGYIEDPFAMAQLLPFMMQQLKQADPQCSIMIDHAGRGGLYIITLGMMLGAYGVRVGMEDALYLYPHKDEMIPDNVSVVKTVVSIAKSLGRRIGSAADYRKFIGV